MTSKNESPIPTEELAMQTTQWFYLHRKREQPGPGPVLGAGAQQDIGHRLLTRQAQALLYQEQNPLSVSSLPWKHQQQ